MTSQAPESPEVVGARARARVAAATPRRPITVLVVAPSIRQEQTPAMMPPPPSRYVPVSLGVAPVVTWEQAQTDEASREPWAAIGARLAASPALTEQRATRRMPWGPPAPVAPTVAPVVPDLVQGAEEGARRGRLMRAAAILAEAGRLLAGEPVEVRERAKRALDRGG